MHQRYALISFRAATFACCLFALAPPTAAENWPEFRGPNGQGHSIATRLPVEWGPEKNVGWKTAVPGNGWSSPVVQDGRIYLTTAVPVDGKRGDQSLRVLALDGETGNVIWNREVFHQDGDASPRIHDKNSHASATPIVWEGRIYAHFGHQGVACLDLDGNAIWTSREVEYRPVHGNGGSPVVFKNLLIFSSDGAREQKLNALDRHMGELVWQTRRGVDRRKKFSFSTPLIISVDGQPQVVSPGSGMVGGYDPANGKEVWRVEYDGYSVVPRPVYGHGLVFISTGYDSASVLAIRPTGKGNVTETHVAWRLRRGAPHSPSMLLVGDELYMISDRGVATCVDAMTGQIHWQERLGGRYSASPIYADGKIYAFSEEGEAVVFAAARQYRELARNDLKERTLASAAVVGNALLIRTANHLYCIESP